MQKLKTGTYDFFTEAQTVTQKAEFNYNILAQGMQTSRQFIGINIDNMSKPIKIELRGLGITAMIL